MNEAEEKVKEAEEKEVNFEALFWLPTQRFLRSAFLVADSKLPNQRFWLSTQDS